MPNLDPMSSKTAKHLLFVALIAAFATGCATPKHYTPLDVLPNDGTDRAAFSRAKQRMENLFPAEYRATQRAIVTAGGKQFTCDGLLKVSPAEGHHLAIVSTFGVVTDLRVKADGGCELLKVTPLLREDWSRRFVARDLRWLFVAPAHLRPAGHFADGKLNLLTAEDSAGVTAQYVFSPDGTRWQELDLWQDGKTFYRVVPKHFRKFAGTPAEVPDEFDVSAEAYRLELRIAELTVPNTEVSP